MTLRKKFFFQSKLKLNDLKKVSGTSGLGLIKKTRPIHFDMITYQSYLKLNKHGGFEG